MADLGAWILWWAIGGAVVLLAALLLLIIILTATGIQKEAARTLTALRRIDDDTQAIWALGGTTRRFEAVRRAAESIEAQIVRLNTERTGRAPMDER